MLDDIIKILYLLLLGSYWNGFAEKFQEILKMGSS
jgi:hypothetical protein